MPPLTLDGTNGVSAVQAGSIQSDDLAAGVGGKVLQVVQNVETSIITENVATNSLSTPFVSASITPSSATSKILITTSLNLGTESGIISFFTLVKDGSAINDFIGDAAGSRQRVSGGVDVPPATPGMSTSFTALDSPATTSSITYDVRISHNSSSTRTMHLNRGHSDGDFTGIARAASTITLMEIAG